MEDPASRISVQFIDRAQFCAGESYVMSGRNEHMYL